MQSPSAAQKRCEDVWAGDDPVFTSRFYEPYKAAVETAFAMIDAARSAARMQTGEDAVHAVTFRLKTPASIRGKLRKKGLPASAPAASAALHDIAGLRVVLHSIADVYRFSDLLRALRVCECVGIDDYIRTPKESGYRSLHLLLCVPVYLGGHPYIVPVEVQLRTAVMDAWATLEHRICYKPDAH